MTGTRAILTSVCLDTLRGREQTVMAESFNDTDRAHYESRPLQSMAAALAAKRATIKLLGEPEGGGGLTERQVTVLHDASGKPHVSVERTGGSVMVSVSHTRSTAYALVCAQEEYR